MNRFALVSAIVVAYTLAATFARTHPSDELFAAVTTQDAKRPKKGADAAQDGETDFRAQALLLSAKLHFAKDEFSQGKAFLASAIEADPSLDNLETRTLNMMYPDFPFVTLPELSYERDNVSFSGNGAYAAFFDERVLRKDVVPQNMVRQNVVSGEIERFGQVGRGYCLLSPTGRYLAEYSLRSIFLYDCESNSLVGSLVSPGGQFRKTPVLAFSADDTEVAMYIAEDEDKVTIQFRRTSDFQVVDELDVGELFPITEINSLLYLNGKGGLIIGRRDEAVVIDRDSKKTLRSLPTIGRTWCLDLTADESLLACGGWEVVHVYDVQTGRLVLKFRACTHNVIGVGFLLGNRFVAWSSANRVGGIADVATGARVHDFSFGYHTTMAVNRSRLLMAVGGLVVDLRRLGQMVDHLDPGLLHTVQEWKTPDAVPISVVSLYEKNRRPRHRIRWQVTSPSGKQDAYATDGGEVFILNRVNDELVYLATPRWEAAGMAFLDGGRELLQLGVSGNGQSGVVQTFDIETQRLEEEVRLSDPPVSQAISPDEKYAVMVDRASRVWLFDLSDIQQHVVLLDPVDEDREARFSKNGNRLIIRTGETWRKYDFRMMSQKPAFSAADFGYQIDRLNLQLSGITLRRQPPR